MRGFPGRQRADGLTLGFSALLLFVLTLSTTSRGEAQQLPETGFQVGEPFPTTAFPSLEDGTPMSVVDFRGKRLILHIFASW